jgi:hypothetical protein
MAKADRTRRTLHFNGNLTHYRMDSRTSCPSVIEMPASTKSKMLQVGIKGRGRYGYEGTVAERGTDCFRTGDFLLGSEDVGKWDFPADPPRAATDFITILPRLLYLNEV